MKIFIKILFLFLSILVFSQEVTVVAPLDAYKSPTEIEKDQYERIISFHSNIVIAENADVTVTETIKVYATGNVIKRGIFRALPTIRNINDGQEKITYKIISIKKDGIEESYHKEIQNGVFNLYIGNKEIYLQPGFYTYEIIYKTQDQIGKFEGYDEFYWNVNGTDWQFPIEKIQATITLPNGATILQNSCYTGTDGSRETNCTSKNLSSTKIEFKANDLKVRENLTIAVGFKAGVLKEPTAFMKKLKRNWPSLFLIVAGFYLFHFFNENWKKYGKDPEKPVVIPQFNAPKNLSPASLGYIDKGEVDLKQVTANLIDLSIKGFVTIEEVKDDAKKSNLSKIFKVTKIEKKKAGLQDDQQLLIQNLFAKKEMISIKGTYDSTLKNTVTTFQNFIKSKNKIYIEKFPNNILIFKALKIILIVFFSALLISAIVNLNPSGVIVGIFSILFIAPIIALLLFLWTQKSKVVFFVVFLFTFPFIIPLFFFAFYSSDILSSFESDCFKFLIISIVGLLIFRYLINKPSEEKVKMEAEIEGFKMYLGTAEENQLKFHNPPDMTTEVYEKFLPYAIVFGVQGIWGKRFRNKLKESMDAEDPNELVSHLDDRFANSLSASLMTSSVAPASRYTSSSSSSRSSSSRSYSGGSSSSGSSGGGSSGGGGGGGGGGGW